MEPTIGINCLTGCLFVLVVTKHHIHATRKNLAWHTGMAAIDAHLHTRSGFATRVGDKFLPVGVADDG